MSADERLTDAWLNGLPRAVTHDEHVRIAFVLLRRHGRDEAKRLLIEKTQLNCELNDAAERFDERLTGRWADALGAAAEQSDLATYEAFIAAFPHFAQSDLLGVPAWKLRDEYAG